MPRSAGLWDSPLKASLLVTAWLGLESFLLGPFSYIPLAEFADGPFPQLTAVASGAALPGAHYWLPGIAFGVDRLANGLMTFQAPVLLLMLLPGWAAFQIFLFLHYFLSSYFTARLAVDFLKTSPRAAVLAAFAGASVPFTGGIGNSVFPFVLWAFDRLLDRDWRTGLAGALGLGLFFSLFASAVVTMPFCFLWTLAWLGLVRKKLNGRALALGAVFVAAAAAPHLRQLWAMWANAPFSHRAGWGPVWECTAPALGRALLQGLNWGWSVGAVGVCVAALGLAQSRFRPGRFSGALAMFALTVLAAGLGEWLKTCAGLSTGPLAGLHLHRFYLILPLAGALAGAAGLGLAGNRRWVFALAMAAMFARSAHSKSKTLWEYFFQGGYAANFQSPVLEDLARRKAAEPPFRVATFTHGLVPGYALAYGLESVDGYVGMYSGRYFNFWREVIGPVIQREPYLEDYFGRWGSQLYLFLHSVDDWPQGVRFADHYRLPLLSLANAKYVISRHPLEDPNFKLRTPQKPWRAHTRNERAWLRIKENFTGKTYFYLYENAAALPRAFLVPTVKTWPDQAALWKAMSGAALEDLKKTVFVEEAFWKENPAPGFRKGRADLSAIESDRLELSVELDGPGVLVVSNSFNRFWTCRVDGAERRIFPAYGAFWGVALDRGDRKVEFSYDLRTADIGPGTRWGPGHPPGSRGFAEFTMFPLPRMDLGSSRRQS